MNVVVNGEDKEFAGELSILELLKQCEVQSPEMVSVEHNEELLTRDQFEETIVKENDEVDFLFFMGGGC